MLPSKTIPEVNRKGKGRMLKPKAKVLAAALPRKKAKMCSVEVEEVEDEDSTRNILSRNASVSSITEETCVIQSDGGSVSKPSFLIYIVSLVMFCLFLVSELLNHHQVPDHDSSVVGSAVAVERVFSGGRDTISLCRASLNANTIHILMLVRSQARLAHTRSK
jgi:hypothetical protein